MELQSLSSKKKRFPCKYEEDHSHRRIRALAQVCYGELMKDYGHLVSTPVDVAEVFHDRKSDLKMDILEAAECASPECNIIFCSGCYVTV